MITVHTLRTLSQEVVSYVIFKLDVKALRKCSCYMDQFCPQRYSYYGIECDALSVKDSNWFSKIHSQLYTYVLCLVQVIATVVIKIF